MFFLCYRTKQQFCSLSFVFPVFFVSSNKKKKLGTIHILCVFLVHIVFQSKKQFSKTVNKPALIFHFYFSGFVNGCVTLFFLVYFVFFLETG